MTKKTIILYRDAENRVFSDESLRPYADTILADYPEGDDHWLWVIEEDACEILAWAIACNT